MAPAVTLHPWNRRDRSALEAWPKATDPLAWLWSHSPRLPSIERSSWGIESAGDLVGRVTLRGLESDSSLGIYLRPDRLGEGIGRAALVLALDLVFGAYDRRAILLDVAVANTRATRCYLSLGFTVVQGWWGKIPNHPSLQEHQPQHVFLGPPPMAVYWDMRLTAMEWEEHKATAYAPTHTLSRCVTSRTGG